MLSAWAEHVEQSFQMTNSRMTQLLDVILVFNDQRVPSASRGAASAVTLQIVAGNISIVRLKHAELTT